MAVTQSPRLGLTRWSAGTDPFQRSQLDGDHAALEALAAIYGQGTFNARPAAGTAGRFYFATDTANADGSTGRLYYDTGAGWVDLGDLSALSNYATTAALAAGLAGKLDKAGGTMTGTLVLRSYTETVVDLGVTSGTITLDNDAGTVYRIAPNAAVTIQFANFGNGDALSLRVNSAQAGYGAITWPAGLKWQGGKAPNLPAGTDHELVFWGEGGTTWAAYAGEYA